MRLEKSATRMTEARIANCSMGSMRHTRKRARRMYERRNTELR